MKPLKQLIAIILLASFTLSGIAAQLSTEQQQAKQQGKILWNQNKRTEAAKQLLVAAKAGDEESQYLLADSLSRSLAQFPKEEYQNNAYWYESAANQGNVYAMYRLNQLCQNYSQLKQCHNSTDHWSKVAMDTLKPKIATNNPEAFYQYYIFTRDINYLKKSAEANFPEGQYRYAKYLENKQDKKGSFKWYKQAADNNHVKSMDTLSSYYIYIESNPEKAQEYLLKAVEKSNIDSINSYRAALDPTNDLFMKQYGTKPDKVKSYALSQLVSEINSDIVFSVDKEQLSPEEFKQAQNFLEQWQKEHPPLSYYPSPVFNGSLDR